MTTLELALGAALAVVLLLAFVVFILTWASRRAARRHAIRLGIDTGSGRCRYEHEFTLSPAPAEMLAHARTALAKIAAHIEAETTVGDVVEFSARTEASARSFGEVVLLRIARTPAGRSEVRIQSQPARLQLFDGGANAETVARLVRELTARARIAGAPAAAFETEPDEEEEIKLVSADWLALCYLLVVVGYSAGVIWLGHKQPSLFESWIALVPNLPLDPVRLLGGYCAQEGLGLGILIDRQLDLMTLPTLILYGIYNLAEFRQGRERMDGINWLLAITALIVLPLLYATSCVPQWREDLLAEVPGLSGLLVHFGLGGVLHAVFLLVFLNAITFVPAALTARLLRRGDKT